MRFASLFLLLLPILAQAQSVIRSGAVRSWISNLACSNNIILLDFDAATDGAAITSTLLTNSTHGGNLSFTNDLPGDTSFTAAAQYNLQNSLVLCGIGTFAGAGAVGFQSGCSSNVGFQVTFPIATPKLSWGYWFRSTIPGNAISYVDSCFTTSALGTADFLNVGMASGADDSHFRFTMEHHGGNPDTARVFLTNTVYWITALQDTTANYQLSIYDNSTPPVLITNLSEAHEVGAGNIQKMVIGYRLSGQSVPTAKLFYDNFKFNTNGTFPLMP